MVHDVSLRPNTALPITLGMTLNGSVDYNVLKKEKLPLRKSHILKGEETNFPAKGEIGELNKQET